MQKAKSLERAYISFSFDDFILGNGAEGSSQSLALKNNEEY